MPTNLPRHDVTFPEDLYETIIRDAELENRSISGQVIHMLKRAYQLRKQEAELFNNSRLHAGEKAVPVYETPSPVQTASERASKIRELHGPEKS